MDSISPSETALPPTSLRSTILFWLIWVLWLPLFIPSIVNLLQAHPSPLRAILSVLGALAFFALYVWMAWVSARSLAAHTLREFPSGWALWWPVVALVGLATGLTFLDGYDWGVLFIYVSSGVTGWLPPRKAAPMVAGLVLFIALSLGAQGKWGAAVSPVVFVGIVGLIVIAFGWSVTNSQQLRLAREEMGRTAAINEERLRIARDLHDLLGHNLSLIALKSELARRLIEVAPERAAAEIGDIEQVARTALQEVREAVANYRTPTLTSELRNAETMLEAAGITYRFEGDSPADAAYALPRPVEAVLSWAVREGVTNVIRHSRAHSCAIRLEYAPEMMTVMVKDDGAGNAEGNAGNAGNAGNGLRGLAERVAALGGKFEAGLLVGGGYRLLVSAPLHAPVAAEDTRTNGEVALVHGVRGGEAAR